MKSKGKKKYNKLNGIGAFEVVDPSKRNAKLKAGSTFLSDSSRQALELYEEKRRNNENLNMAIPKTDSQKMNHSSHVYDQSNIKGGVSADKNKIIPNGDEIGVQQSQTSEKKMIRTPKRISANDLKSQLNSRLRVENSRSSQYSDEESNQMRTFDDDFDK